MIQAHHSNPGEVYALYGALALSELAGRPVTLTETADGLSATDVMLPPIRVIESTETATALDIGGVPRVLDWWTRPLRRLTGGEVRPWKPWAGQLRIEAQGMPALIKAVSGASLAEMWHSTDEGHDWSGLDIRKAWTALDVGFSPDAQGLTVPRYPTVTLLACVGLQVCPPLFAPGDSHSLLFPVMAATGADVLLQWPIAVGVGAKAAAVTIDYRGSIRHASCRGAAWTDRMCDPWAPSDGMPDLSIPISFDTDAGPSVRLGAGSRVIGWVEVPAGTTATDDVLHLLSGRSYRLSDLIVAGKRSPLPIRWRHGVTDSMVGRIKKLAA